jgi:hypothetical protein
MPKIGRVEAENQEANIDAITNKSQRKMQAKVDKLMKLEFLICRKIKV